MPELTMIGFDADDTLWENEHYFRVTESRVAELLVEHAGEDHLSERLLAAERRNLALYGFGIKGFILSLVETAIEVSEGRVPAATIARILEFGHEMLRHPIDPLPHARDTLEALSDDYRLVLITKGDLFDQERKLAQSGLGDFFDAVEIVSNKTRETYEDIFNRHGDGPARAMMVGNSLKSDILPALEAGSFGIFVPHHLTWALEHAEKPPAHPGFAEIRTLAELPDLVAALRD